MRGMNWCWLGLSVWFFGAVGFAQAGPTGPGSLWEELTELQQTRLMKGEQIASQVKVAGSEWPNSVGYQWIDVSAEQAAAVFAAYELQATYIPKVIESRISRVITPDHVFVDYKLDAGYLGIRSTYTVENRASFIPSSGEYRLKWDRVTASHAKVIDGMVRVQPHAGGAIFFYQLYLVIPSWPLQGLVQKEGFASFKATLSAIFGQIKKEKGTALLEAQVLDLRRAVGPTKPH